MHGSGGNQGADQTTTDTENPYLNLSTNAIGVMIRDVEYEFNELYRTYRTYQDIMSESTGNDLKKAEELLAETSKALDLKVQDLRCLMKASKAVNSLNLFNEYLKLGYGKLDEAFLEEDELTKTALLEIGFTEREGFMEGISAGMLDDLKSLFDVVGLLGDAGDTIKLLFNDKDFREETADTINAASQIFVKSLFLKFITGTLGFGITKLLFKGIASIAESLVEGVKEALAKYDTDYIVGFIIGQVASEVIGGLLTAGVFSIVSKAIKTVVSKGILAADEIVKAVVAIMKNAKVQTLMTTMASEAGEVSIELLVPKVILDMVGNKAETTVKKEIIEESIEASRRIVSDNADVIDEAVEVAVKGTSKLADRFGDIYTRTYKSISIEPNGLVREAITEAGEKVRFVVPKGFDDMATFSKALDDGLVNFAEYGCKSESELKNLIKNMNDYLGGTTASGGKTSFTLMKNAGTTVTSVVDGIGEVAMKYDKLGFPVFEGSYLKGGVNISNSQEVISKGLKNMSSDDHMREATKILKNQFEQEAANLGKTIDVLLTEKGFSANAIQNIKSGATRIEGFTWHHHQTLGNMQLVVQDIHTAFKHNGGYSLWGK